MQLICQLQVRQGFPLNQRREGSPRQQMCPLKALEELQRELVAQEHGGAHGEASDGVHRRAAEEHLHTHDDT